MTWAIGGSFATTIHGEPRSTNDIDVVARLAARDARRLVVALGDDFYADESMIAEAIAANESFNVIDPPCMCSAGKHGFSNYSVSMP